MINQEKITQRISNALDSQFEIYSWEDMINDCDDLTPEEKIWAKNNLSYKLINIKEEYETES